MNHLAPGETAAVTAAVTRPRLRHHVRVIVGRWWPEQLDDDETRALERADDVDGPLPDVLVVGGGIMGVSIATALRAGGAGSVLLLDAGRIGSGSSGGAAGLLTPEPHDGLDPDPLVELGRESLDRWRRLDAEADDGLGVLDLEWVGLLPAGTDASGRSARGQVVDAEEIGRLVPGLSAPMTGLRVAGQARVNPLRTLARLAGSLPRVATEVSATEVTVRRGRITTVETSRGRLSPGAVVFATGGPPSIAGLGVQIPADFVRGHMLVTEPVALTLPGTVDPLCTQLEDGRLLVGGTLDVGEEDPTVDPETLSRMLGGLAQRIPALEGTRVARAWCCFRPHHPDDLPTIDRVPDVENAWFTAGHYRTGILMAPATAAVISEWMDSGVAPARATPFRAERLG